MKKIIAIIIILLTLIFLYGHYIEINNLNVKEYIIHTDKVPATFKDLNIVQFSDLLYNSNYNPKMLDNLLQEINDAKADILIFSGDLFKSGEKYSEQDLNTLKEYLTKMEATQYKLAVIGDNDQKFIDTYKDILYESGFKLLDNANMLFFYKDNTPINIIGLTNLDNINDLLVTDTPYNYSLVITHEPDNITSLSKLNIDTVLSGHSLGGIINVPYYGGLIKKEGATNYINNYYKVNNTELFITNGLGYEKFNFRLLNTPSINVYKFAN